MGTYDRIQRLVEEILKNHIHRIDKKIDHGFLKADIHNRTLDLKNHLVKVGNISDMYVNRIVIFNKGIIADVNVCPTGNAFGSVHCSVFVNDKSNTHEDAYDRAMAGI